MQLMHQKITRRQMGLIAAGLGATSASAQTNKPGTAIHQEIDFPATQARIYEILLDAKQFTAFTKAPAEIRPQPGAAFKLFGALIEGRNVELAPNQRIVQAWRSASWPAGEYTIVRFELVAHGSGSRVILDHAGFTEDKWEGLSEGWHSHYWEPLRAYLKG
jgi:activator of HSP90 ATPase